MTPSVPFQLTGNRKKYFYAFDKCFRQFLDKALQKPDNMLTLFGMGDHDGPPKMFLTTVSKCLGGRSRNLVTFNINLCSI